jgi:hypothetical protein
LDELEPLAEPLAEPVALPPELEPAPALLGALEVEPEPDPMLLDEPPAAVPLRLLCWSALEPAPALSRWHAVMPNARTAAARAAVRVLNVIACIS